MINTISDGQPITYDLLNQIISEVNALRSTPENQIKQIIQFFGAGLGSQDDSKVSVATGLVTVGLTPSRQGPVVPITFNPDPNFDTIPFVVTSIVDTKRGDDGAGTSFGNPTVVRLNKKSMSVKIQLVQAVTKPTTIDLHYIAIGASSSS